jgi:hypothetical protein
VPPNVTGAAPLGSNEPNTMFKHKCGNMLGRSHEEPLPNITKKSLRLGKPWECMYWGMHRGANITASVITNLGID